MIIFILKHLNYLVYYFKTVSLITLKNSNNYTLIGKNIIEVPIIRVKLYFALSTKKQGKISPYTLNQRENWLFLLKTSICNAKH